MAQDKDIDLNSRKLKSIFILSNPTKSKPFVVGSVVVVSIILVLGTTSLPVVSAKILPTGRPDIRLDIGIAEKEIEDEEGGITYERKFATEENFQSFYNDVGKVHQVFDEVMVPAATQFVGEHWSELADKNVDFVWITYNAPDSVFVSLGQVHGTVNVEEPSPRLEIVNSIFVRLPVSWWYYQEQQSVHWLGYGVQIPNASARIAFLTYHMQDILERHRSEMITIITVDENGAEIGKVLGAFSAVMLEDMARITMSYRDEGYAYVGRVVTEYVTGTNLILPLPPSTSNIYTPPDHGINEPMFFAKSVGKPLSVLASLSMYGTVTAATLTYPDGRETELEPVRMSSGKTELETEAYNSFEYVHYIPSSEPSGIYQLTINASATSTAADLNVFVTEKYLPPDYGYWSVDSIVIDDASYPVRYKINTYTEVDYFVDLPAKAVMVRVDNANEDSRLIIELQRSIVDSVFDDGADKAFFVTLSDLDVTNGSAKAVEYDEIFANEQVRVVAIELEDGTDLVQIAGTQILPEFGSSLAAVIVAAITGIIVVINKVRISKL